MISVIETRLELIIVNRFVEVMDEVAVVISDKITSIFSEISNRTKAPLILN